MHLELFLDEAVLSVARQNGPELAEMLRVCDAAPRPCHNLVQLVLELRKRGLSRETEISHFQKSCLALCKSAEHLIGKADRDNQESAQLWLEAITRHLRVALAERECQYDVVFNEQTALLMLLQRIFASNDNWMLPAVYVVNEDLWRIARLAGSEELKEQAARLVNKSLTICLTDRSNTHDSRKWGTYRLVGLLFRIYFHLEQLNLCANVLRAMGAADLPPLARYPPGHVGTFCFFLGKYFFLTEDYVRAEAELLQALQCCPSTGSMHNKRLILHYLVPLRLICSGKYPTDTLMSHYSVSPFYLEMVRLLKAGDLQRYAQLLTIHRSALLKLGTFMIWEKLTMIAYRSLLRRVYLLLGASSRLSLPAFYACLRRSSPGCLDVDEAACIAANLIDRVRIGPASTPGF